LKNIKIYVSRFAEKQLAKLPVYIQEKVFTWRKALLFSGLSAVRLNSGYHDEPLKGKRSEQRSVRLNRSYRLIYEIDENNVLIIITILEVNKHDYR
jgi:toxin HigB-1